MTSLNSVGQVRAELNLTEYLKISCLELGRGVELIELRCWCSFCQMLRISSLRVKNNSFATEEDCDFCFKNKG